MESELREYIGSPFNLDAIRKGPYTSKGRGTIGPCRESPYALIVGSRGHPGAHLHQLMGDELKGMCVWIYFERFIDNLAAVSVRFSIIRPMTVIRGIRLPEVRVGTFRIQ